MFSKALRFLRVTDEKKRVSLTNVAVWVVVFKLAGAQELDFASVAALIGALTSYQSKRYLQS